MPAKNLKSSNLPACRQAGPKGLLLRAGGRGVRGEFCSPSQSRAKSVWIFSNTHRQILKIRKINQRRFYIIHQFKLQVTEGNAAISFLKTKNQ
jgi:hypothetical protein